MDGDPALDEGPSIDYHHYEWQPEEKCLAPYSENEELCEAVVKSIDQNQNGVLYATVLFLDSKETRIPLSRLCKVPDCVSSWNTSMFDDEDLEKPFFPDRRPPGPSADFPLSNTGVSIPFTINRYLREYQRVGVQFLYRHFVQSTGCILGDDMGLGKTIQVISFLAAVLHKKGTRQDIENNMPEFLRRTMKKEQTPVASKKVFLIVSPLSVLFNWKDELEVWGYFKVTIIHGNKKDFEISRLKQGKYEVALTTYETLRLFLDELNSIDWSAVIVDEAHRIKNPKARVTQVMKDLRCKVRIGLTGTILQNNMEDLWCVMDWAVPGCLGSRNQFKEEYSNPLEYGQRHNATKRELATGRKAMQNLARKMSNLFLRRTKALISNQLPKKEDRIVFCSLSDFQKAIYQTVLKTEDVNLVLKASEPCTCNSGRKRRKCCYQMNIHGEKVKELYFSYLAILRKVSNHAALLQTGTNTSKKQEAHIKRVCNEVFSKFPEFVQQSKDAAFETISDPKYSGKMKVLQQLLNHCRKNKDKVLLFSFSTKLLDVLERYCMASGLDYRRLDGSTKPEERVKIVKEFNRMQDVNICLVSTMAGGLGLNFVGANVVVVFDPTWNPANDLQAIDRAYRIGQCRDVKVFRLISLGTVEEMIYLRQVYKQQLHCVVVGSENAKRYFEAVQGSKDHKGELFGMHNLFKLRTQGTCLTRDILEREGQVEAGVVSSAMYVNQKPSASRTEVSPDADENTADVKPGPPFPEETFDFSSDSEEESKRSSKLKSNKSPATSDSRRQLTLQQCGFSKLLESEASAAVKTMNSEITFKENLELHKINKSRRSRKEVDDWSISSDSEEENVLGRNNKCPVSGKDDDVEAESKSDDSGDVIWSSQKFNIHSDTPDSSESDEDISIRRYKQPTHSSSDFISDESDDVEIPKENVSRSSKSFERTKIIKNTLIKKRGNADKNSQTIDAFSSSDDDHIQTKKIRLYNQDKKHKTKRGRIQMNSELQRLNSKNNSVAVPKAFRRQDDGINDKKTVSHGETSGSLDKVFDGIKEVAYIHSNQNVVGSSKAENHMSRWAVRDVFELNQFSQFPANIMTHGIKTTEHIVSQGSSQETTEDGAAKSSDLFYHPVIHKEKKVHRIGDITYLIGETPKAMRRKQYEEMVAHFNMTSAEQFAHHVLNAKSDIRQDMLRQFYTKQYSDVKDLYAVPVPKEKAHKKRDPKTKTTKKRNLCIDENSKDYESVSRKHLNESRCQKIKDKIQPIGSDNIDVGLHLQSKDAGEPPHLHQENSSKNQHATEGNSKRNLKIHEAHKRHTADTQNTSLKDQSVIEECTTSRKPRKEACSITDLLGDTSILDDLFTVQATPRTVLPVRPHCDLPATNARRHSKDFWDILSEQNEESINRLTDLSVIENVCERSILFSSKKKDNWDNNLWVKNEKFLWRKNDSKQEVDYALPGKSSDP
ncbi:DNA excision repair protein ERCC-6-like 2 [Discoglossus pictus]